MTSSATKSVSWSLGVQCFCTGVVAVLAAYASYRHGREFAVRFGADGPTASIWPLIVDGLLTTATVELWRPSHGGGRWAAWVAFGFGISLSLCANIGSAPRLTVFSVVIAACPPLALLLAVELLNRALKRHRADDRGPSAARVDAFSEPVVQAVEVPCSAGADAELALPVEGSAEQQMWAFYLEEQAAGRTPTGADLDRVVGTNNYGRRVLRRWRVTGRGPDGAMPPPDPGPLGRPHRMSPVGEGNTDVRESTFTGS
ncbi:hypothetical protein Amsp01_050230 [Amycolatopsis sp. NBRC 101858]|uniref:DUF2637 domain-containing protein n=1 Tax=Amycolatopsis sp. NBRC 101858 TaxID=3032200 RepID=UPI00249FC6FB|nr:DUF2637 domain-containing protein [Amycolatopsis sp. NBRC 101858]GLY38999.1 hypothetical protein Amsp01_050230 [Amycolatopsis sp. NBRC 101858]